MIIARVALRVTLLSAAFALATLLVGWWGVAIVAIAWGIIGGQTRGSGVLAAAGALLGWALLLAWSASRGPVGELAARLGDMMGAPAAALIALSLVFPAALAWAGARAAAGASALVTSRGS